ncbi:MAG: hypothetical protein J0H54_12670 [Rhizobiales bacterium]|nr:hypothetical protein [Hyphomicrobiales bacterium]
MDAWISFALSNFTLTFLALGLVVSLLQIIIGWRSFSAAYVVEAVLRWFLFFSIGVSSLYNFVMHVFFGEMAARFIGWADSPFQAEVGFASLGFALVGFLAFRRSFDMRLAAIIGPSAFLLGAAGGHVYQMLAAGDFAPGNAGIIFWTDIGLPIFGMALLYLQHRIGRPRRVRPAMVAPV